MLTATAIRNAQPGPKSRKIFDGRGLYLEVSPKGGKWWRLKYRFHGKEKRLSLGVYPDVSLQDARERRDAARKLLANDVDPSAARKAEQAAMADRAANSFEVLAREWFAKHVANWSDSHTKRTGRFLEGDLFPWLGAQPIADLTAHQVLTVVQRVERRGAVPSAHRVLQVCGQVFRYAVATGRAARDPTVDLKGALAPFKGRHFAAVTEPQQLGELLRAIDGYQGSLIVGGALRLAPLVFVRPGELRHAAWGDIDLEAAQWRFTVSKTHTEHIVPLARQAVEILAELRPLTEPGRYVFPSARNPRGDRPMSDNAVLAALRRMGIGKEEMSGHGFRATARTILDEVLGFRPDFIERQLAHMESNSVRAAYTYHARYLDERRTMMQWWADYLDELKSGAMIIDIGRRA